MATLVSPGSQQPSPEVATVCSSRQMQSWSIYGRYDDHEAIWTWQSHGMLLLRFSTLVAAVPVL